MTLHVERVCRVISGGEESFIGGRSLGMPSALTVLELCAGAAELPGAVDGLAPPAEGGFVLCAGSLALSAPGGCTVAWAALTGAGAEDLAAQLTTPLVIWPEEASGVLSGAGSLLQTALLRFEQGDALSASAAAWALLCRLAAPNQAEALPPLVAAALAEIREHYGEVYGIEELAEQLSVSKSHLIRSFTAAIGVSPGRYLTSVRIAAARRLLLQPELTLEAVASLCGFSGANYLCRVFKKETGETPIAWRRREAAPPAAQEAAEWEQSLYL